jgi:AcrR family transcriptional regulator
MKRQIRAPEHPLDEPFGGAPARIVQAPRRGTGRARRGGSETRARLLRAARAQLARHGFEGASTHRIAADAGVPQGLVRHHFGGKEGLHRAVLEQGARELASALEAMPESVPAALAERLRTHEELLRALLHGLLEGGERARTVVELCEPVARALARFAPERGRADPRIWARWLGGELAVALSASIEGFEASAERERPVVRDSGFWPKPAAGSGAWSIAAARTRRAS